MGQKSASLARAEIDVSSYLVRRKMLLTEAITRQMSFQSGSQVRGTGWMK